MRATIKISKLAILLISVVLLVLLSSTAIAVLVIPHSRPVPQTDGGDSSVDAEPSPSTIQPEEYAVYSALFRTSFPRGGKVLIGNLTVAGDLPNFEAGIPADVQSATIDDYRSKGRFPGILSNRFDVPRAEVILVEDCDIDSVLHDGRWDAFWRKYHSGYAVFRISRVGFNRARDQAVLHRLSFGGPGVFNAAYVLLEKDGGVWRVKKEFGHMMS